MGLDEYYENPYLKSVWQEGHQGANPTYPEGRISLLYSLLPKNVMPWMWDHDHYPNGKDDDMYGIFYPEDFETILQISHFESLRKK
jgi:hypothetical protein